MFGDELIRHIENKKIICNKMREKNRFKFSNALTHLHINIRIRKENTAKRKNALR